eukprot:XP_022268235.1 gamma-secretase subunit APH-1B [Canis lupus familiaris]
MGAVYDKARSSCNCANAARSVGCGRERVGGESREPVPAPRVLRGRRDRTRRAAGRLTAPKPLKSYQKLAFFWLVSLLFSSLFWFVARTITANKDGPIQKYLLILGVLVSVLIQELFRFVYYKLLKKASEGLKSINPDETTPSMRLLAYVSGLGFGIMSGVFAFVNTLSDSLGPGTVGIHGDSPQFFLNSAFMTLVIILLHVFWGIIFFDGCEKKKWSALLIVLLTHLLVSALTFISPHYGINLVSTYMIMLLMGIWAFFVAGGSCRNLKLCLLCQDKDFLLFNQRSR